MTTIDTRPANPAVIDGQATTRHTPDNPYRLPAVASGLIVIGAAVAAVYHAEGSDLERGGATFAPLIALVLHITAQIRFHARAKAGDR